MSPSISLKCCRKTCLPVLRSNFGVLYFGMFHCWPSMQKCLCWSTKARGGKKNNQWDMNEIKTATSQQQGQGPWLPLHLIMLLIWCVTRWCTVDNHLSTAALSLFPCPHTLRHTHKNKQSAVCQDHSGQPPTCWAQSRDKMDLGAPSLFVFPNQNVNNARCPGEWLKPNTSPLSVCLASDPLWCHAVILKL